MATQLEVSQLALSLIGDKENITSITSGNNQPAIDECSRWYAQAKDQTLKRHNWIFPRTIAQFEEVDSAVVDSPNHAKYPYVYVRLDPTLYFLQWVEHPRRGRLSSHQFQMTHFRHSTTVDTAATTNYYFLSDHNVIDGMFLVYTDLAIAESEFPDHFTLALAHRLAAMVVTPILRNSKKTFEYDAWANNVLGQSAALDSEEDFAEQPNAMEVPRYAEAMLYGRG